MPTLPTLTPARDDSGDYLDVDAYAGHASGGAPAPAPAPARDPHPPGAAVLGSCDPSFGLILGSRLTVLGGAK